MRRSMNAQLNDCLQRQLKTALVEALADMDVDIKGAISEGLLEKTARSSDKGAEHNGTPRPLSVTGRFSPSPKNEGFTAQR